MVYQVEKPEYAPILEPESVTEETPPSYPYNKITQTESGHIFELDDTPNQERIKLAHRIGTFIEMHSNGDEVHKVYGDGYEITIKNKNVIIKGHCNITIDGDCTTYVKGNKNERIDGDYNVVVNGDINMHSEKTATFNGKEQTDIYSGLGDGFGDGVLNLHTGGSLYLRGDLDVEGTIRCADVMSSGRIDAATGISAGPMGFVSLQGGLSIGIPIAIPGIINCIGMVNSDIMNAGTANFGTMSAVWMTDLITTKIYNTHTHIVPDGTSGPPISTMI